MAVNCCPNGDVLIYEDYTKRASSKFPKSICNKHDLRLERHEQPRPLRATFVRLGLTGRYEPQVQPRTPQGIPGAEDDGRLRRQQEGQGEPQLDTSAYVYTVLYAQPTDSVRL